MTTAKTDDAIKNGFSEDEDFLYDPEILLRLEARGFKGSYKNDISPLKPGNNFQVRPLSIDDYDKGYIDLLRQLTSVGDVSRDKFIAQFKDMKSCRNTYYVTVIEDTSLGKIVGSASLVLEKKFIHQAATRGRVEDVVVSDQYRGQQLGKVLVDVLVSLSQELNCYKTTLECVDPMVQFYAQFGFDNPPGQNFMQQRFFD